MEISAMRHTNDPYKTNRNILTYPKFKILSTIIIRNDNSRIVVPTTNKDIFNDDDIARIVHKCIHILDESEFWIVIDFVTGEIKISGEKLNNILSLFDDKSKTEQSLDELINLHSERQESKNINKSKYQDKEKGDSIWI